MFSLQWVSFSKISSLNTALCAERPELGLYQSRWNHVTPDTLSTAIS